MKKEMVLDYEKFALCARKAAAEGAVLLENNGALPLKEKEKVAIFGRSQFNYFKSGTGSGGLVNTPYEVSPLEALQNEDIFINEDLKKVYEDWIVDNPFDEGAGWAMEPWSQKEMPVTSELVNNIRKSSDKAIIIIARLSGEDKDSDESKGSYRLSEEEEDLIKKVTGAFKDTIVLLNVGGIIDMSWVDKYSPSAVLYIWQGGMEGGNAVADLLMGRVSPSGHLSDTIAKSIFDYPAADNFGGARENEYKEDIYVGYRYFETFAKDKVRYPFGYGLSYTSFGLSPGPFGYDGKKIELKVSVENIGDLKGKDVVLIFIKAPQGKLGKPVLSLIAYEKTRELSPREKQEISFSIPNYVFSSFDDGDALGFGASYVLEKGIYEVFFGENVRDVKSAGSFEISEDVPVEKLGHALSPTKDLYRIKPKSEPDGSYSIERQKAPKRQYDLRKRIKEEILPDIPYDKNKGFLLKDVYENKISMEEFLSQLTDEDLRYIVRGEGMCSGRVTPGCASAFGGVTDSLTALGIPAGCCSDGPSGIRMDCGTAAFLVPNGTCLACTFNDKLNEELYYYEGLELRKNRIDTLLGPGINIHRHPLNGRNFEYFSEDPLLTGKMAAAQLRGMGKVGVTGTIKHFACNNQESNRHLVSATVSERALREIYLKGFEIAVKEGGTYLVMTSYSGINGLWSASNFDLNTTILRGEWGFEGMVMTDWWATMNDEKSPAKLSNLAQMVEAGNDVFMVVRDAVEAEKEDNLKEEAERGRITRPKLLLSAKRILGVIMRSPVMKRTLGEDEKITVLNPFPGLEEDDLDLKYYEIDKTLSIPAKSFDTSKGKSLKLGITPKQIGRYSIELIGKLEAKSLAQIQVTFFSNGTNYGTKTLTGAQSGPINLKVLLGDFRNKNNVIRAFFSQGGITLDEIKINLEETIE